MQRVLHRCVVSSTKQNPHHLNCHTVLRCKARTSDRKFGADRRHAAAHLVQCLQTQAETPINKAHGGTVMTDQLYGYLLSHTHEHEVPDSMIPSPACRLIRRPPESTILQALTWLREQTAAAFPVGARMQVSPEQAQFLAWLVKLTRSTKALELGVFTGYSALAVALVSFAQPSLHCWQYIGLLPLR